MEEGPLRYACIDLKTFYASVECADRGLDPFQEKLVVADPTRGPGTICLAITPALKALGVKNRCRVFEIPKDIDYIMATPRMARYLEVAGQVNAIYARHLAPEDMHIYSVDECFLDLGPYLRRAKTDARGIVSQLMREVLAETGVTATAGLGTNLFLAKVALDILAKHASDGIAALDEAAFRKKLWFHRPLTDIWGIGPGTERRLRRKGITDLAGVCAIGKDWLIREFGIKGEWLLDHAWGQEPCTMADVHAHRPVSHSLSSGQVLMRDYSKAEARIVLREMALTAVLDLRSRALSCGTVSLWVGYARALPVGNKLAAGANGRTKLPTRTSISSDILPALLALFDQRVSADAAIRRISLSLDSVAPAQGDQPSLFAPKDEERQRAIEEAMVAVRSKFGKNSLLTGTSLYDCSTMQERNQQIGGHRA